MAAIVRSRGRLLSFCAALAALTAAALVAGGAWHSARAAETPLLPRLEAETPDGAYFETNSFEHRNRLLLKFNGYIHNGGRGAIDIRGERAAPNVQPATEKQVEQDRSEERETLSESELAELGTPTMKVIQREFTTTAEETNIERQHVNVEQPKSELVYSASDGHDHWHLQHVAKYQLVTKEGETAVSPGQKVGFCLDDSKHSDTSKGPSSPVYEDHVAPFRDFCQRYKPDATSLFEGISVGWSDLYGSFLAWQWVDASNVVPGEYLIYEEVDPEHLVDEEPGGRKTATSLPVVVPGYDAEPVEAATEHGEATTIELKSREWIAPHKETEKPEREHREATEPERPGPVAYAVAHAPEHGQVTIGGGKATYTPEPGYSGVDHFTYVAKDSQSEYPWNPREATATVVVGQAPAQPEVTITQAPSGMTTGTTAALTATEANDASGIKWSTTGGAIAEEGNGEHATLTAPAGAGKITVTAELRDHEARTTREITVSPPPPSEPAPSVPGESTGTGAVGSRGVAGTTTSRGLSHPRAMLFGHRLVITTTPYGAGRIKVTALLGKHVLGFCEALTPARRQFTCRIKLAPKLSLRSHIAIVATLKHGPHELFTSRLAAHAIPQMKMVPIGSRARAASAGSFWCSPGMLVPTLEGG